MTTDTMTIAEARRAELESLVGRAGTLAPKAVVEFARNPETALHALFEWDDSLAAEQYRIQQAHAYIRAVATVVPVDGSEDVIRVRAFVSLNRDRGTGSYRSIAVVMEDPTMRDEMVREALSEYQAFRTKYKHLTALAQFFAAADSALPNVG
jgi:hypothetical protein